MSTAPLTVVTWKWRPPKAYRSTYPPETVHALRRMVAAHYAKPFRFVCVTDDPAGLEGIETIPIPDPDLIAIPAPEGKEWPSCYVRLRAFAADAAAWLGPRYVSLDLDTVIVGDLAPLFDRAEDLVIWNETDWPRTQFYNASVWLHTPGTRRRVWDTFDPATSPEDAYRAGGRGGDQAWISHVLGPAEATFRPADGVLSFRRHIQRAARRDLPKGARIVNFHGAIDPWAPAGQRYPWVREYYGDVSTWGRAAAGVSG